MLCDSDGVEAGSNECEGFSSCMLAVDEGIHAEGGLEIDEEKSPVLVGTSKVEVGALGSSVCDVDVATSSALSSDVDTVVSTSLNCPFSSR